MVDEETVVEDSHSIAHRPDIGHGGFCGDCVSPSGVVCKGASDERREGGLHSQRSVRRGGSGEGFDLTDGVPRDVAARILHAGRRNPNEASHAVKEREVKIGDGKEEVSEHGVAVGDGDVDDLLSPKDCSRGGVSNWALLGFLFFGQLRQSIRDSCGRSEDLTEGQR
jgi:hypothetical protein